MEWWNCLHTNYQRPHLSKCKDAFQIDDIISVIKKALFWEPKPLIRTKNIIPHSTRV